MYNKEKIYCGFLILIILCFMSLFCEAQCPTEGLGRNDREKNLNKLKNRDCVIDANLTIDSISIDSILRIGNDLNRFKTTQLVTVVGYVTRQKSGEAESCNCKSKNKKDWDIHLEIGKNSLDNGTKCFIAEVTPRYIGRDALDWKSFVGRKVQVTGYIFYDEEHKQNAVNTNPEGTNLWRATIVELHPVIGIVLLE